MTRLGAVAQSLFLLLACQAAGEALRRSTGLPVPGPVWGLALLAALLAWRGGGTAETERLSRWLLDRLALFFIPAGVGLIDLGQRFSSAWRPLLAVIVGSTVVTLIVTGLVFQWVARLVDPRAR